MRKILTNLMKKVKGRDYIHIPKWFWLRNLLRKVLVVERVRGRGRNWVTIGQDSRSDPYLARRLRHDGHVHLKYASYLYMKLK